MGKRGPAPLPQEQKRQYRIGVYFSEAELSVLETIFDEPGLAALVMRGTVNERKRHKTVSEFMRTAALGGQVRAVVPKLNMETYAELGRFGARIRQVQLSLEDGVFASTTSAAKASLKELVNEIAVFRQQLLGGRVSDSTTVEQQGVPIEPMGLNLD